MVNWIRKGTVAVTEIQGDIQSSNYTQTVTVTVSCGSCSCGLGAEVTEGMEASVS